MTEPQSPRRILEFLMAAGIDITVGDDPVNRLQPPPAPAIPESRVEEPAAAPAPVVATPSRPAPTAPDDAIMQARLQARAAQSLDDLAAIMAKFDGCALKATASRLVFADGNPQARVMIIGEAPGREEDETGRPFVGRAGQLLDKMLKAIGLDRTGVYIANVVPWRPPGNRTPTPQEVAICLPFIHRQIELAAPDFLLTMGAPATQNLTGRRDGILRLRGQWFEVENGSRKIPTLATLHPAYLLRQPAQKALAWRDLRALRARLVAE
jgi:uracil-DNA glycosylase family 4